MGQDCELECLGKLALRKASVLKRRAEREERNDGSREWRETKELALSAF